MIPLKLKLYDFLSHDNSEIDFTRFKSALILGSYDGSLERSNGSGKSSIVRAISWALFEKTDHRKKDGVVKHDKKCCKVIFEFDVNGQYFKLTRKRDKVISESDIIIEQRNPDGTYKDISCDTNTLTNQKLEEIVGFNYDVFVNSIYFKQNDVALFTSSTAGKRKDIVKSLLQIEQWDKFQKEAREKARSIQIQIEEKQKNGLNIDTLRSKLTEADNEISNAQNKLTDLNKKHNDIKIDLENLRSQSKDNNSQELFAKIKNATDEYNKASAIINKNNNAIIENNNAIDLCNRNIDAAKKQSKLLSKAIKDGKNIDINKINGSLLVGKTKERVIKEKIDTLSLPLNLTSSCPTCKKTLSKQDIAKLNSDRAIELEITKEQYTIVKRKLKIAENKAKELRLLVDAANKAEIDKSKIDMKVVQLQAKKNAATKDSDNLKEQIELCDLNKIQIEINELKRLAQNVGSGEVNNNLEILDSKYSDSRKQIDELNIKLGSLLQNKTNILEKIQLQNILQEELDKLKSDYVIVDKLREYFGKDGIQAIIIDGVIDELENHANEVLAKICNEPTSISVKTQKQTDGGSWQETFDIEVSVAGRTDDLASFSGGEQFRVSMAIRLALSKILARRMGGEVKFLLLDEVDASLDDKGIIMFSNIVRQLSEDMKILIISHNERIKDHFDDIIVVDKTHKGSRVIY